jgi:hypothetical protein
MAIDLRLMKSAKNAVIGFEINEGFINTEGGDLANDRKNNDRVHMAVPALEVKFHVANGESRQPFVITLASVLPLISALAEWGLKNSTATVSDAMSGPTS